ncbi:right-handed parallel beta-helix repeat-containing protein [Streptomyces sp. LX-29]|uniref:right-handed parallel beta-helix repeat-containing protein n=1 Tax=Streptomyces sp. LX-29 TaxID=2900152 RepID=UPI00240CFFD4|nr:right-handed parallel beta-helix repeat-containing protein [Streptomyces sp. LX-29]WFB10696.1 right-handed parallel beta-helix repeat-containing protein [Streptomyces sp. LX-29]
MNLRKNLPSIGLGVAGALAVTLATTMPAAAQPKAYVSCAVSDLIDAIDQANAGGGGSLLLTPGCTYQLTAAENADDGLPEITTPINILGAGATITRAASAPDFRIFHVTGSGNLNLTALTVSGGSVTGSGGGILNEGQLTLNASFIGRNAASDVGGGLANTGTANVNAGTRLASNTAVAGGGGLHNAADALTRVSASSVDHNTVTGEGAQGGGVLNAGGTLQGASSAFGSNSALAEGATGGGIATLGGSVTLTLGTVESNRSDTAPGGIYNDNSTVTLTLVPVFNNNPTNCSGSPDPVPGCLG